MLTHEVGPPVSPEQARGFEQVVAGTLLPPVAEEPPARRPSRREEFSRDRGPRRPDGTRAVTETQSPPSKPLAWIHAGSTSSRQEHLQPSPGPLPRPTILALPEIWKYLRESPYTPGYWDQCDITLHTNAPHWRRMRNEVQPATTNQVGPVAHVWPAPACP